MRNFIGDPLKFKFNMARFIYVVVMSSIVIYAVVVTIIFKDPDYIDNPEAAVRFTSLRFILYGLAVSMFFVVKFVRNAILPKKTGPAAVHSDAGSHRLLIADVVTAALCESVAIFGLVIFLLGRQIADFYTLVFISLAYFLYFFPRYSQWENAI
ncbi:MAG: hypothetical protein IH611_00915 [Deltaproteobacteria bacterium]|nr:hypothetical protein [Deltaproteobacteria bacterium]